jgi:hypothetical protein
MQSAVIAGTGKKAPVWQNTKRKHQSGKTPILMLDCMISQVSSELR